MINIKKHYQIDLRLYYIIKEKSALWVLYKNRYYRKSDFLRKNYFNYNSLNTDYIKKLKVVVDIIKSKKLYIVILKVYNKY